MVLVQVLGNTREVLAGFREMFHNAGRLLAAARSAYVEIRDVPVLEKLAQGAGGLKTLELTEALDG